MTPLEFIMHVINSEYIDLENLDDVYENPYVTMIKCLGNSEESPHYVQHIVTLVDGTNHVINVK